MPTLSVRLKRCIIFAYDLAMIPLAWLLSYALRFNLEIPPLDIVHNAIVILPLVITLQGLAYWRFGLYRGIWRFASLPDLIRIIKAVGVASLSIACILFFSTKIISIPRSILPLYFVLLMGALAGSRLFFRLLKDKSRLFSTAERVLIVGAGEAGESLARDLLRRAHEDYNPIAFVDDNPQKQGQDIHGIRIVGTCEQIPKIIERYNIQLIFIALPSASSKTMRRIMDLCAPTHIPVRTLPSVNDIANGRVNPNMLREVSLDDLLGRDPLSIEWEQIDRHFAGKCIAVSGGGGSIGSELCRQIAQRNPAELIVIEQCEFNLYTLQMEMQTTFPQLQFHAYLADVSDRIAIRRIFQKHKPHCVFHAAAYKHVPLLETHLRTAMRNNMLGTRVFAEEAVANQVNTFVLISTDKAVNPTNIMGSTKRAAELLCQNFNAHSNTHFITVRFGNVLGSAGSVVPLFRKQIEAGGPVTVTHPEITRFFMTIPEATQLILQATIMAKGGEIFVLDMGEPIKIRYLAEQLIHLSGRTLGQDIDIQYTGLRPGEKLYEELFHENEALTQTSHNKILQARYREMNWDDLTQQLNAMDLACQADDEKQLYELLRKLVPEFQPHNDDQKRVNLGTIFQNE